MSSLHERVEELFQRLVELPPERQSTELQKACSGAPELFDPVNALLRMAQSKAADFLDEPAFQIETMAVPRRIGTYEIVREIGRGGMGTVFEARQEHPARRVALKILHGEGVLSASMRKRFENEARVLGTVSHPGIAQIFEASAGDVTCGELPFLAMELIDGVRIDRHADRVGLDVPARLELIAWTAEAVEHLHERSIVHRDLKPDNVLVRSNGRPVVVDLGLARSTSADLSLDPGLTRTGHLLGTMRYMAPEQIAGTREVTVAADVHALGVIAYELLCGRFPFAVDGLAVPDLLATLRDVLPMPLGSWNPALRGDIEVIVGKALAKEPERRYTSAGALAADIRRFLRKEPILARRPSHAYRMRCFVARHRVLVAGSVALFLSLALGLAGTSYGLLHAEERRREANDARAAADREKVLARTINEYLLDAIEYANPEASADRPVTVREIFANAAVDVERRFPGDDPLAMALRSAIGRTLASLGQYEEAAPLLGRALGAPSTDPAMRARTTFDLARVEQMKGEYPQAIARYEDALEATRALPGDERPLLARILRHRGHLAILLGDRSMASELLQRALTLHRVLPDPNPMEIGTDLVYLSRAANAEDRVPDAERHASEARQVFVDAGLADLPMATHALSALADVRSAQGRHREAIGLEEEALHARERTLGSEHPEVAYSLNRIGNSYHDLNELEQAESFYRRALDIRRKRLKPDHFLIAETMNNLAILLQDAGRDLEQAEQLLRDSLSIRVAQFGEEHHTVARAHQNLATFLSRTTERLDEAVAAMEHALAIFERVQPRGHSDTRTCLLNLALLHVRRGAYADMLRELRRLLDLEHEVTARSELLTRQLDGLPGFLERRGRLEDALTVLDWIERRDREGAVVDSARDEARRAQRAAILRELGR
ncbi:MAG: serine/threonine protein kinase [Planctomycetes bacterium]|nr:serine/threonine protein kinase [Planctomycetota bacterium]